MKARYISVMGLLIASTLLFGCGKEATPEPETKEAVQQMEEVAEETQEETLEEEEVEEADPYQNTISDETKEHAKSFPSIDEQYSAWRGTHVNNKFEYAWVAVEPYTTKMDEFVAANDDVDWSLVEASNKFDEATFEAVSKAGYNFVRIPLDTRFFFTDDKYYNVESTGETWKGDIETYNVSNWQDLDKAIGWCIDRDMHVCIDVHSTPGGFMIGGDEEESRQGLFSAEDSSDADVFLEFWNQAANRYQDIDAKALSFNLYNEPPTFMHDRQDDYADLMCKAIEKIRGVSPERLVFVDALDYSTCGLDSVEKFSGIDNLIFSFHYYSDYQWSTDEMLGGNWKAECDKRISRYNEWAETNGVKWMLQEYGIQSDMHDLDTRLEFIKYVTECVAQYEVPYCHYGFATGTPFNFYDGENVISPELVELTVK
ncbi:MAG: glycoside hydrolase family 5 protein [Lachnospiraceae bacterium]|nr:glycoside hydrolase family 5 protein [Lachnospiraceae bacterium]